MTIKTLLILVVLGVAGYFAYVKFGGQQKVEQGTQNVTENVTDPYKAGEAAFTGGLWQQVVDSYSAALKQNPKDSRAVEAEYRIARALEKLKRDSDALHAYEAFLAKNPNHADKELIRERLEKYKLQGIK
jgi:outer membrane protein assembly factor BamD (BamD/ComL family)